MAFEDSVHERNVKWLKHRVEWGSTDPSGNTDPPRISEYICPTATSAGKVTKLDDLHLSTKNCHGEFIYREN